MNREILRYAAFTVGGRGGNPAGVVLEAAGMSASEMQAMAAMVGYSETAFVAARREPGCYDVRYFAPKQEVPFCGHATIATAVALAERGATAELTFHTRTGVVPVSTTSNPTGPTAELTSVQPRITEPVAGLVHDTLDMLHWSIEDLDPDYPSAVANAGANHLVLAARSRQRLADLDYDFDRLADLMRAHNLVTLQLVWRESPLVFHARDPFPVGGVVEDPATGAAAAALGGYLRHFGLIEIPAVFTIRQGEDMGAPSELRVELAAGEMGVRVRGHACPIRW